MDRHYGNRERASRAFGKFDFLKAEGALRLADRLDLVRRDFPLCLDFGCHDATLTRCLQQTGKVGTVIQLDPSFGFAKAALANGPALVSKMEVSGKAADGFGASDITALPFSEGAFDAIFSCLSMHWIDDLPGLLMQMRQILKPDGLLLVSLLGGTTLSELRAVLAEAEAEITGGLSPRTAPMADIRDLGGLLGRAGFALPVADSDRLTIEYPDIFRLMADLRGMGEQNALKDRLRTPTSRRLFLRAGEIYQARYGRDDGSIPASFEIVTLTGWTPHESQQKPLRPGSARHRLASSLDTIEQDPHE